jgi:DNA repair protein SbcC/Rad50
MRLLRLEFEGIGPFVTRSEIDFAGLGENGLFLLEGPTGSGKSTIIDAISFALYGRVAGAETDADRLRSHFASAEAESYVDLVFRTQSGRYRVRRTPKFQRPKRRGDGLRTVNPTVSLWRLTDAEDLFSGTNSTADLSEGTLLSTRIEEVADEISRAIGLTHAQFVQTVVLPQGEFASFLRASSDDKRALLQKLFGTELLARVQAGLISARQLAEQQRAGATQALTRSVHEFAGAAGLEEAEAAELDKGLAEVDHPGGDCRRLLTVTDAIRLHLTAQCETARLAAAAGRAEQLAGLKALQRAEDVAGRRARRRSLQERLVELTAGRDAESILGNEIAAAERAAPLGPIRSVSEQAARRHADAVSLADAGRVRLPARWRNADELNLRAVVDDVRRQAGALTGHLDRESDLAALRNRHRSLAAEQIRLMSVCDELSSRDAEIAVELTALRPAREQAAKRAADAAAAQVAVDQTGAACSAAKLAVKAAVEVERAELAAAAALSAERLATDELHILRRRRLDGIAGELGQTLAGGQPCPVCGSCEHPAPARPALDHVTEDRLRAAEAGLAGCNAATTAAAGVVATCRARWSELNAQAGGSTYEAAKVAAADARRRLATAIEAGDALARFDAQRETLDAERAGVTDRATAGRSELAVLADQLDRTERDIAETDLVLVAARAGFGSVAERLVDLDGQAHMLDDAIEAIATATSSGGSAVHARSALDKALADAGFDSEEDYLVAHRLPAELAALRRRLTAIVEDWASVTSGLAATDLTEPDIEQGWQQGAAADEAAVLALAEGLAAVDARYAASAAAHGSARDRLAEVTQLHQRITDAAATAAQVFAVTTPVIRLGNIVAGLGDNQLRMDLSTYVLVRRFEQIVAAANDQLRRISGGRYELEHSDAKHGNARSGLGLRVHDLRTDRSRDPATLSGGETFYVSLSLALGLADVVRAESGGIDLGTLFIDEGFGSLDSDVLDEVLSVLDGLRAGGRAVGVVSHVAELKARIVDRVEVRHNPDGTSRLRVLS